MDDCTLGGLIGQPLRGGRVSAKMLPLSMPQMPADFINSYILHSVGTTGTNMGACASFLYNLRQGVADIQSGKARVVVVGSAEAPLMPSFIDGFCAMGALAEDRQLRELDNSDFVDHRRACRPFSTNVGFTLAEAAQLLVLMDDELALELGVTIHGAVGDVFINADGNKKSIASPGVGNYVTMAKATALAKAILGTEGLHQTYVQAHGTSTPVNRVTESHILNEMAKTFGIARWPVAAIKSYVGHSLAAAAGDQIIASLGVWKYGWVPGIKTIDHIADDVSFSHLNFLREDWFAGQAGENIKAVIINSKGFGGNNASAVLLSPQQALTMLGKRYGARTLFAYHDKNRHVAARAAQVDEDIVNGNENVVYETGTAVMDHTSVSMTPTHLGLSRMLNRIELSMDGAYEEYL
jgi:acetoacetyl-[acyl-carrier protein] synthase